MTIPIYQEFTEAKSGSNTLSITIDKPANTVEGSLLIAVISTDGDNTASCSDWTAIEQTSNGTTSYLGTFYKIVGDSEPANYTFELTSNEQVYAFILRITEHDYAPINISGAATGTSSNPECPDITTTRGSCLILRIFGADDDDITVDSGYPGSHIGITVDESTAGNNTCAGGAAHKNQTTAGATGTAQFTMTASEQWVAHTIAIAPLPFGGVKGSGTLVPKPMLGRQLRIGHPLTHGLVGCWLMNEGSGNKIYDLSGNNHVGTRGGTGTIWTAGKFGPAQLFNSNDDYITMGDSDAFSFTDGVADKPFSVLLYLKTTATDDGNICLAKYWDWDPFSGEYNIIFKAGANGVYAQLLGGLTTRRIKITGSQTIASGVYYQLILTYDGFGSEYGLNIYLDGVIDASATKGEDGGYIKMTNYSSPLEIGVGLRGDGGTNRFFDGVIDYFYLFNRALSASEIAQLYQFPFCMVGREPIELWAAISGAVGDLTVNVSDSVIVAESVTPLLPLLEVSISETTVVAESVTSLLPLLEVAIFDSVVVAEDISAAVATGVLEVSLSDSLVVSENVTSLLPLLEVDLSTDIKTELADNNTFGAWTSDDPDDWTVMGESGSDPEASEVGSNEGHGGTGKGLCNLYTSNDQVHIYQDIATTVGKKYRASIYIDKVTSGVIVIGDSLNVQFASAELSTMGKKVVEFTATDTLCRFAVWTKANQANDITVDNFSLGEAKVDYAIVTESITAQLPLYEVSVSDSIVVVESVTAQLPLYEVSLSESVVVSELVTALLPLYEVVEYEAVVVTESISASIYTPLLSVSESESIVIGESVLAELMTAVVAMPIISSQGVIHDAIFSGVIVRGHNK